MRKLKKWKYSNVLTLTRTFGELRFRKNGTELDIWLRVNDKENWYSVHRDKLVEFLTNSKKEEIILKAISDGNVEKGYNK